MPRNVPVMLYDGGCPICRRGVEHYRRVDWARRVSWVDFLERPDVLSAHGIDFPAAMGSLHVVDRDGEIVTGAPAFLTIWNELPYYRVLARMLRFPGLLPLFSWLYELQIRDRYARRCREGVCAPTRVPPN